MPDNRDQKAPQSGALPTRDASRPASAAGDTAASQPPTGEASRKAAEQTIRSASGEGDKRVFLSHDAPRGVTRLALGSGPDSLNTAASLDILGSDAAKVEAFFREAGLSVERVEKPPAKIESAT